MLYYMYEAARVSLYPWRMTADAMRHMMQSPLNPVAKTHGARQFSAALDVFEHATRRYGYGRPDWNLPTTSVRGQIVPVTAKDICRKPFGSLVHFERDFDGHDQDPKLLLIAPMSGHYATLLRGTVETFLPQYQVFITDWVDARMVPVSEGSFDLDDYIDYLIDFMHVLGPNTHVMAVCQPAVPMLAAAALMAEAKDDARPQSMILMAGPIDARVGPTEVTRLAASQPLDWFRQNVVMTVPPSYPGAGRLVYPGFIQLANFMSMNLTRHLRAHKDMFDHVVAGETEKVEKKKKFYEEYRAMADLSAEFYLQTVDQVFQSYSLPQGQMVSRGRPIDPSAITDIPVLCIEAALDDVSGIGQTRAAHDITPHLPESLKHYYLLEEAGHYGVFTGSRFHKHVVPLVNAFVTEFHTSRM